MSAPGAPVFMVGICGHTGNRIHDTLCVRLPSLPGSRGTSLPLVTVIFLDAWKDLSNSQATRAELVRSIEGASNKVKNAFDEIHESIAVNFAHNSVVYQYV